MNLLSCERFEQAVRAIKADSLGRAEKRSTPRIGLWVRVTIYPYDEGICAAPLEFCCRDISRGGIGLLHDCPMSTGQQFLLILATATGSFALVYSVVKSRQFSDGIFAIGAVFLHEREPACFASTGQNEDLVSCMPS